MARKGGNESPEGVGQMNHFEFMTCVVDGESRFTWKRTQAWRRLVMDCWGRGEGGEGDGQPGSASTRVIEFSPPSPSSRRLTSVRLGHFSCVPARSGGGGHRLPQLGLVDAAPHDSGVKARKKAKFRWEKKIQAAECWWCCMTAAGEDRAGAMASRAHPESL
ncbi:hypothetical protein CIRG_04249 [Coccidioides immitis RMSCC 2394]|uniref:Uncharacterized protein n=1 Tax=Coccidioides immitis RMSCC 2394 TaxID=404692 RepID=A0A0J6YBZ0_COCIT|nr:hypothetical protein CIRG_04249 [Coccidioides immitis RMSCC 2394]